MPTRDAMDPRPAGPAGPRRALRPLAGVRLAGAEAALLAACWALALAAGLADSWNHRFRMNPDGLSYFEIGEAFWRLDLRDAVNGYWNPLYPVVLGLLDRLLDPPAAWEFQVVHLANFLIYALALATLAYLLFGLIERDRRSGRGEGLPIWAWLLVGHGLFLWATRYFTPVSRVNNDLLALALLLALAGLYARLEGRSGGRAGPLLLLGGAIGLVYLAKLAAFYAALLFLPALALVDRRRANPWRTLALGLLGCGLVAAPFVVALSLQKGRLTIGDKGRIAYAWIVNDVEWVAHWQGEPPGSGKPAHPTRRLTEDPPVFEFATPVAGTYPPSYDPSYWYEGVEARFDWRQQWRTRRHHPPPPRRAIYARRPVVLVLVGLAALAIAGALLSGPRRGLGAWAAQLPLGLPALSGMLLYAPVHVLPRYYGAFVLLGGLAIVAAVRPAAAGWRRRIALALLALFVALLALVVGPPAWSELGRAVTEVRRHGVRDLSGHRQLEVARRLRAEGLEPGDRIAHIGNSYLAYWARLARLEIVAEIPYRRTDRWKRDYTRRFQELDGERRTAVLEALASPGVAAIVASNMPLWARRQGAFRRLPTGWKEGWKTIVDGDRRLVPSNPRQEDGSLYLYRPDRPPG